MAPQEETVLDSLLDRALTDRADAAAQREALDRLGPSDLEPFTRRLSAYLEYRSNPSAGGREAARLAAGLGISQRSFFYLLARARQLGPVTGLIRAERRNTRGSVVTRGLHQAAEAALQEMLAAGPEPRFNSLMQRIVAASDAAGVRAPSTDTVKRRLVALRGARPPRHLRAGRSLVIVQHPRGVGREDGGRVPGLLTLVVDADVGLILGFGFDGAPYGSLAAALDDCLMRGVGKLAAAGVPFATKVEAVELALHADLAGRMLLPEGLAAEHASDQTALLARIRARGDLSPSAPANVESIGVLRGYMFAVREWNAEVLSARRPRARTGFDEGGAVMRFVNDLKGRLERSIGQTG